MTQFLSLYIPKVNANLRCERQIALGSIDARNLEQELAMPVFGIRAVSPVTGGHPPLPVKLLNQAVDFYHEEPLPLRHTPQETIENA